MTGISVRFTPGQTVVVLALNVQGFIENVLISRGNVIRYDVTYWFNGNRETKCLTEEEIDAV